MDVLSQAVREFQVAVDDPQVGITTPSDFRISPLTFNPPFMPMGWPTHYAALELLLRVGQPKLRSGWAIRPAQGHTKGVSYFRGEFVQVARELFELGEGKRGCKYSAHQMHAEMLRRFPNRYDTPSIGEIMAGVADLIAHKKKGTVPGLTRLGRKLEDKFPEVFKPLLEECERVHALSGQGKIMSESEAMDWLNAKKPGCAAGGGWPEAMGWPEKMETNVRTVHGRWKKEKAASTSAAGASASQGGAPTAAPGAAGPAPESS